MSLVATEQVLVVPTRLFHEIGHFQGFSRDSERYLPQLFKPEHLSYRPRGEMEQNPSFKQLIPYVLFRHVDEHGNVRLFDYLRGSGLGERRLHAKRSVGVGGHISTLDAEAADHHDAVYREGLERELAEEVIVDTPYREECVGLINDDETDVGKVHLGVVHLFDVETPDVRPREADMLEAGFRPVDEILTDLDRFESWSQIAVSALFGR